MSLDRSDTFADAEHEIVAAATPDQTLLTAISAGPKEPPRKRYAAPSAPRVLRCMQTISES